MKNSPEMLGPKGHRWHGISLDPVVVRVSNLAMLTVSLLMLGKTEGRRRGRQMVRWHHWLNGRGFKQAQGGDEGQGGLACGVHGIAKCWTQLSNWKTTTTKNLQNCVPVIIYIQTRGSGWAEPRGPSVWATHEKPGWRRNQTTRQMWQENHSYLKKKKKKLNGDHSILLYNFIYL